MSKVSSQRGRSGTAYRLGARIGTGLAAGTALCLALAPAAAAADGGSVSVTNTETVQAYLDASGKLDVARIYEQLALQGNGTVEVVNPVSTSGLRNLDGFGGVAVKDGAMVGTYTVSGDQRVRTVSNFDQKLPLTVAVSYTLDGKKVEPSEVAGATGALEVRYRVENVTGKPTDVSYADGKGGTVTSTESVPIPMVGSLSLVLPSSFTDVSSAEANMAGDGRGGTKMSFTMTLFPPIGSPVAEFGYKAHIAGGSLPPASITALPVSPLESPSFKGGAGSYKSGAETGVKLTDGATQIDTNLLKLRDGAGTLLAGLIQLRDGANQLSGGLTGQAAPGAEDLSAGARKLDSGAQQLATGLSQAGDKAPALISGLSSVQDGLGKVDAGLTAMYAGIGGLPAKAQPLHDGIAQLRAGIGSTTAADTLLYGVDQVRAGLAAATATGGSVDRLKGGVDQVKAGLDAALAPGGSIAQAEGGILSIKGVASCAADPICMGRVDAVAAQIAGSMTANTQQASVGLAEVSGGMAQLKTKLSDAVVGLIKVECGLSNTTLPGMCDPARPGLLQGLGALDAGVTELVSGVVAQVQGGIGGVSDTPANLTLRGGINGLQDGVGQIQAGGATLLSGLGQLSAGANQLADGTGQLAAGAGRLADGLDGAASGSVRLADGLAQAVDGASQIPDGAGRLSTEGTSQLVKAGQDTALDYGKKYAVIEAGAARAKSSSMAIGAPSGAAGFTAYSLEIAGVDGQGGKNLLRLVLAGLGFAGAGALALRRRSVIA
ncbi:MAG: hypothetical protein KBF43_10855 [Dermatophilaceae bacterium]|nr:hypothetical protein [Dermatophilaceae bacterium]MBP9919074.1 hypothetical protein [Dermatophilaceae bacterium]